MEVTRVDSYNYLWTTNAVYNEQCSSNALYDDENR